MLKVCVNPAKFGDFARAATDAAESELRRRGVALEQALEACTDAWAYLDRMDAFTDLEQYDELEPFVAERPDWLEAWEAACSTARRVAHVATPYVGDIRILNDEQRAWYERDPLVWNGAVYSRGQGFTEGDGPVWPAAGDNSENPG